MSMVLSIDFDKWDVHFVDKLKEQGNEIGRKRWEHDFEQVMLHKPNMYAGMEEKTEYIIMKYIDRVAANPDLIPKELHNGRTSTPRYPCYLGELMFSENAKSNSKSRQTRKCVLNFNILSCYKSWADFHPKEEIDLNNAVVRIDELPDEFSEDTREPSLLLSRKHGKKKTQFTISTPQKNYFFIATQQEAQNWVAKLIDSQQIFYSRKKLGISDNLEDIEKLEFESNIYFQGFVWVPDTKQSWKKRWAILKKHNIQVYSNMKVLDQEDRGHIPLCTAHICESDVQVIKIANPPYRTMFEIRTHNQTFLFSVENSEECRGWIQAIQKSINEINELRVKDVLKKSI